MSKHLQFWLVLSIFFSFGKCPSAVAQQFEVNTSDAAPYDPLTLINNYFLGEGVDIIDIKYSGTESATGLFSNANEEIGIDRGIILSTGKVKEINRPFDHEASTVTSSNNYTDDDITTLSNHSVYRDIASYEITFIPTAELISFNYVFASEEYPDYVCSPFNDVFGFFVTGPNPNGPNYNATNIAIVPNSQDQIVSINSVNNGIIGAYGNSNNCTQENLSNGEYYNVNQKDNIVFNGILDKFTASVEVIPCQTYTIKIIVADIRDELLDSAVFLEAKSFSSNDLQIQTVNINANGIMVEGCKNGILNFVSDEIQTVDYKIPIELIGSADKEIDYVLSNEEVIIKEGENSGSLEIEALEDNLQEGIEEIGIKFKTSECADQVFWIAINDNQLQDPDLPEIIHLCEIKDTELDASIEVPIPSPKIFSNETNMEIFPERESIFSEIEVQGIYPNNLAQSTFAKVCIDELEHPWLEDLDIFLYGPDGQFIELTSDNGADGGNSVGPDYYRQTCFSINASEKIYGDSPGGAPAEMVPFTGDFLPEGSWNDFIGNANFQANGTWKLMMIDDYATGVGILKKWSIHFESIYDLSYEWTPSVGLSCDDCPKPIARPERDQTYNLKISDSNGCEINKSVAFQFNAPLENPVVSCDSDTQGNIIFNWKAVLDASEYEISINGSSFENIGNVLTYQVNNLNAGSEVSFKIKAIGTCRESDVIETSCFSVACLDLSFELQDFRGVSCGGDQDGKVIIGLQNSNADNPDSEPINTYTYNLGSLSNQTGIFENLGPGSYTVFIYDDNNCEYIFAFEMTTAENLGLEAQVNDVECEGQILGSILATPNGGTAPYNFIWSNGEHTSSISNLQAGSYGLTLSDAAACSQEFQFEIETNNSFEISAAISHPSCVNTDDGAIQINTESTNLSFEWNNGFSGNALENLVEGEYSLEVIDEKGCIQKEKYILEAESHMETSETISEIVCAGEESGSIDIEILVSHPPYELLWSNGAQSEDLENLSAGEYQLSLTDSKGCLLTKNYNITAPEEISLDITVVPETVCEGFPMAQLLLSSSGGTGAHEYQLNDGSTIVEDYILDVENGRHQITVRDENNCEAIFNQSIDLPYVEGLALEIEEPDIILLGEEFPITTHVKGEKDGLYYSWSSLEQDALTCYDCKEPIFIGSIAQELRLIVFDDQGCSAENEIFLRINKEASVYVPSAFSPNGDGTNDLYQVYGKNTLINKFREFKIYDRFGEMVFVRKDFRPDDTSIGWDGTFGGEALNPGVFVWSLEVEYIDGSIENFKGSLSLIR